MLVKNLKSLCALHACVRDHWQLFGNAWVFLTRFPFPFNICFSDQLLNRSAVYFPVVGLLLGVLGTAVYLVALSVFKVPLLAVLILLLASIYMTGAFHEDGFADACDALGGGYNRLQILEIMKDSRLGTYGTIGLVGLLAIKKIAMWQIALDNIEFFCAFYILAQTYSRWLPLIMIHQMEYVRFEGKAKPVAEGVSSKGLLGSFALVFVLAITLFLLVGVSWFAGILMLCSGALAMLFMAYKLKKAIGGYTGDGLGAAQQLAEAAMYLSAIAVLS